jgi:hypothetical protein
MDTNGYFRELQLKSLKLHSEVAWPESFCLCGYAAVSAVNVCSHGLDQQRYAMIRFCLSAAGGIHNPYKLFVYVYSKSHVYITTLKDISTLLAVLSVRQLASLYD